MRSRNAFAGGGDLYAVADGEIGSVESERIDVYTAAWATDHPAVPGEEPTAQIHSRVFVNGTEIKCASGINVRAAGGDFLTAEIVVFPSEVNFVALNKEEWNRLG